MEATTALWSFALVVGLLTLTPGLDTALILRTSALGHRARAWGVVLGIQTGTLIWGAFTSLGVTALLTASRLAYDVLRWAGALYLLWMGIKMLRATFRRGAAADEGADEGATAGQDSFLAGWRQGTFTNLLNPKAGAFYVAVLPQFLPAGGDHHLAMGLLLTSEHIVLGLIWSTVLIAFARLLREQLRRPRARRVLDRITGTVIAAFGVRLAMSG
ncbi:MULTISPECIES: LysE family translocator [unclassified Streptomyces]|uniref:LysE family translocator n=1 Tax=unclassified Streptomyces TaxID=2593676 RepID=UPI0016604329|nr:MULTISPECIES: LysE family translocator [unclassified Streptomyces]MBD0708628.1 lysine transporter LysE [Streptomyces sp. CBMA291]MBD0713109.1 lysine transporter LysE [Streptomyces sp. CBMA370]